MLRAYSFCKRVGLVITEKRLNLSRWFMVSLDAQELGNFQQ